MKAAFLRFSVAAALSALAACSMLSGPAPVAAPEVGRYGVTVTAVHNGRSLDLGLDQELVVRLTTNANVPFEWSLVDFTPGALTLPGASKFERAPRTSNLSDADGAEVWRFKPAAAGRSELKFEYRRVRAIGPAGQTVTYTVTVR